MRIAVIGTRGFPDIQGGVERHCECLYTRFGAVIDAIKVYRRRPYLSSVSKSAQYSRISFVDLPSTRVKGFEAVFHTFLCCMHLLFHRVDVVHIHNIGPGMFTPLLRLFGFKVVITYHSPNYEHKKWGAIAKMILRTSELLSFGFANKIIFLNKFQMDKMNKHYHLILNNFQLHKLYIYYLINNILLYMMNIDLMILNKHYNHHKLNMK